MYMYFLYICIEIVLRIPIIEAFFLLLVDHVVVVVVVPDSPRNHRASNVSLRPTLNFGVPILLWMAENNI